MIKEKFEQVYKSKLFARCDDTGLVRYFSYVDFPGLQCAPYDFPSSHGHRMQGYFYNYSVYDAARLIVFEHGFGGGHRSYMKEIEMLCKAGFRVFAYDHTGCMESGGAGANGFAQSLCDLNDCLQTLKADNMVNTDDISVVGHSWGGFSALNIAALHPDVKRIVVLSGLVSIERMLRQLFPGLLKGVREHIYGVEKAANPQYAAFDGVETLQKAAVKALLIYSENDKVIQKKTQYDPLYAALKNKPNIEFLLEQNKDHNPNYTVEAVQYLRTLSTAVKKAAKYKTDAQKQAFRDSFDWHKMTAQDPTVWQKITEFLQQ